MIYTLKEKEEILQELFLSLTDKRAFYDKKWMRARKRENIDKHYKKYKEYNDACWRLTKLQYRVKNTDVFGENDWFLKIDPDRYKERLASKKELGKLNFENNYRVFLWYMQERFSADYGTFICHICGRNFYHSPSEIYRGLKEVSNCACGYCTNSLLVANKQEPIYN